MLLLPLPPNHLVSAHPESDWPNKQSDRQNLYPYFTDRRFGALLSKQLKCIGSAIATNDDARVSHTPRPSPADDALQRGLRDRIAAFFSSYSCLGISPFAKRSLRIRNAERVGSPDGEPHAPMCHGIQ